MISGRLALALCLALSSACDAPGERPATWAYLHAAIVEPSCATASCHSRVAALAAVDLSSRASAYAVLVGRTCDAPPHPGDAPGNYVIPFAPERSTLVGLLRGTDVLVMPPDQPLAEAEIELVERWIADGAACD